MSTIDVALRALRVERLPGEGTGSSAVFPAASVARKVRVPGAPASSFAMRNDSRVPSQTPSAHRGEATTRVPSRTSRRTTAEPLSVTRTSTAPSTRFDVITGGVWSTRAGIGRSAAQVSPSPGGFEGWSLATARTSYTPSSTPLASQITFPSRLPESPPEGASPALGGGGS